MCIKSGADRPSLAHIDVGGGGIFWFHESTLSTAPSIIPGPRHKGVSEEKNTLRTLSRFDTRLARKRDGWFYRVWTIL